MFFILWIKTSTTAFVRTLVGFWFETFAEKELLIIPLGLQPKLFHRAICNQSCNCHLYRIGDDTVGDNESEPSRMLSSGKFIIRNRTQTCSDLFWLVQTSYDLFNNVFYVSKLYWTNFESHNYYCQTFSRQIFSSQTHKPAYWNLKVRTSTSTNILSKLDPTSPALMLLLYC